MYHLIVGVDREDFAAEFGRKDVVEGFPTDSQFFGSGSNYGHRSRFEKGI
jgi:hypothetical protein